MSIVYVTRKAQFNAAHRLHNPDEWNRKVYGKCNSPNWHGHNYTLEVVVRGVPDKETGYVIDLSVLKQIIEEHVVSHLDHKNLNLDVDFMQGVLPSTENLTIAIWEQLEDKLPSGELHAVRLFETERNSAEYFGESQADTKHL